MTSESEILTRLMLFFFQGVKTQINYFFKCHFKPRLQNLKKEKKINFYQDEA